MLVPVYARHLSPKSFGVLSLLTITLTLVTIVLKMGLNQAFFRHYYETEDIAHRRRIVGSTLLFLLILAPLATGVLYAFAPQIAAALFVGDAGDAKLLRLIFLISFFDVIALIPDSILRAKFRSAQYSILNVFAFAFQISLISYLVIAVDATPENVLIGRLVGSALEAAIFYFAVRHELSLAFSGAELRGLLAFGTPLIFNQIAATLFIMIDRFLLERMTSEKEVGIYAMANSLVSVVLVLATGPFAQVWTVMRFSVMKEEGAAEYYSRVLTYIVYVSMFLALGVAAVSGDGLLLFGLKGYWPAAGIIPLLALSAVLDSASRVLNIGITLRKRTIYAPIVLLVALGANVVLNLMLIPRYGSMGATIATVLSYLLFCALRYWVSNLFFKVHYEWGRVLQIGILGLLMIAGYYLIDYFRPAEPSRAVLYLSAAVKTALALSFPLILFKLGFYEDRELKRMKELWGKYVLLPLKRPSLKEAEESYQETPLA